MKINKKELVTEVREASSVSQLCENISELGQPCLLVVCDNGSFSADGSFPADLPFITAFAADDIAVVSDDVRNSFDLVTDASGIDEYTEKLFKDKTRKQINEINQCFIIARKGSQEDILAQESRAFYRLMAEKNGGGSNE